MELKDEHYTIQGLKLIDVCQEFGTPLYVYDAEKISSQVRKFQKAFSGLDIKIKYSAKALTNINILKLMKNMGTGLDTVSIPEVHLGLKAGFKPEDIVFTPNCVDFEEIREAVRIGIVINIDNLPNLEKFGKEYGDSNPCCIRLNPNITAEKNAQTVNAWYDQSKFGISLVQFDELHEIINKYYINVNGLHIHSSSVILDTEVFLKGAKIVFEFARDFDHLEFLDFGGGIKVPHHDEEITIDIMDLGNKFKKVFADFCAEYGRTLELWFEPGRFLVSDSGYLLTETTVIKSNGLIDFVGVNSGFNHLIRPMFYDAYHTIVNVSNPDGIKRKYTVVGNLCEIDTLGKDRMLNEVREKDIIAILNAGAYGFSMASNYNSRFRPAEVLIINGEAKLIRRRETFEDLLRNQVEI